MSNNEFVEPNDNSDGVVPPCLNCAKNKWDVRLLRQPLPRNDLVGGGYGSRVSNEGHI